MNFKTKYRIPKGNKFKQIVLSFQKLNWPLEVRMNPGKSLFLDFYLIPTVNVGLTDLNRFRVLEEKLILLMKPDHNTRGDLQDCKDQPKVVPT